MSLQTFSNFISSVGLFQSLFDSQVTCTQVVLLQPGAHFLGAAGGILQLGQIQDAEFILPSSKCTPGTSV